MDAKTKWHSCRLTAQSDSGRVRWCVGQERTWQLKLKYIVFIPIILLVITVLSLSLTKTLDDKRKRVDENTTLGVTILQDTEDTETNDREILEDIKTAFIPTSNIASSSNVGRRSRSLLSETHDEDIHSDSREIPNILQETEKAPKLKTRREVQISALLPTEDTNNKSDEDDDFQYSESTVLTWKVPVREIRTKSKKSQSKNSNTAHLLNRNNNVQYDKFWNSNLTQMEVRKLQAGVMERYIDATVNPCSDFYEFACGKWAKYNPIPPEKAGYDTFEILRENMDSILKDLLREDEVEHSQEVLLENVDTAHKAFYESAWNAMNKNAVTKAKQLYTSCMNEEIINRRGAKPLLNLLKHLGNWPMLNPRWNESEFDWLWLVAQLRLYNNDILISQWVGPDIKNSDEYVIQFDQTTLGMPSRDYFLEESNLRYLEAYRIFMITVSTLLGAPILDAAEDADRIIEFEVHLAKITATLEDRRNVSEIYTRLSVHELQYIIPQIDWLRFLNLVMEKEISSNEEVVCFCMSYLKKLVSLLSKTPKRTIANYVLWRFVRHRANNLDQRFLEAKQRFYYVLFGREKSPSRWHTCVTQVNSNMGMALGHLFVQRYFDEQSKNDTVRMTKEIQKIFHELVENATWLDNTTRSLAKIKIDNMCLRIGYPDFVLDVDQLSEMYTDVQIHPDLYFENTLSILKHLTKSEQARMGTAVNKTLWNTAPAVVNAYYSRNKNQIMFPAGILQPPFYHRDFPKSLNYGGIGVVIGHEITHGFDDKGRLFDKEGNLQRWWREPSIKEFQERAQCLVDQYSAYVVPEVNMKVDGLYTQGENIADNGGIKQAYRAYRRWLDSHPDEDESMPGMNYTNDQMFFINFAQVWCGSARPEATRNKLKTAVHSPGRFRVIGTVSNYQEFSKAFQCPSGSPMNPVKKCAIW